MRDVRRPVSTTPTERLPWYAPYRRYLTWPVAATVVVLLGIFAVGLVTMVRGLGAAVAPVAKVVTGRDSSAQGAATTIGHAKFAYLIPKNRDWELQSNSVVYDEGKGVVRYQLMLKDADLPLVMSQQVMPDELKPQTGAKFDQLVLASNVVRSQAAGKGKVYFEAALTNGVQANGATNVIYATDDILMFGHAPTVLAYDKWVALMASMEKTAAK
jgi:hypothetical protein